MDSDTESIAENAQNSNAHQINIPNGIACNGQTKINGADPKHYSRNHIPTLNGHKMDAKAGDDMGNSPPQPIAIVGMAMRLPGGVNGTEDFWNLLTQKKDGLCKIPESRYTIEAYDTPPTQQPTRPQFGYFLQGDPGYFDSDFFSMPADEAAKVDPQQRLLLEIVWECMENAGQVSWRGKDIGTFVGALSEDWLELLSRDIGMVDRYNVFAADFTLSNRISYVYDLKGPSVTIKTACSSTLTGLHEACQAIHSGECSASIVAGANLILTPTMTSGMSDGMALAPDGISKAFDAKANGYGRGEAVNAILIKRLEDALRDGDPVRAIIRSTAVNSDGKSYTVTSPNAESQEQLIRRTYRKACIADPCQTAMVECHGTGTKRGDTTEALVIAKVFKQGIHIGSVKPNVGHSEGASGLSSIIKSVLALEHKVIPPNAHFSIPNPKIPFKEAGLQVPTQPIAWPEGRMERISINSFGVGGSNAHVILDSIASASCATNGTAKDSTANKGSRLLVMSARSTTSLQRRVESVQEYLENRPASVQDLAFTLGAKRQHLSYRAFMVVGGDSVDGRGSFETFHGENFSRMVFVFTGQGAQWPGMGKSLMASFDAFLDNIRQMDQALQSLTEPPSWSIEDELAKPEGTSQIDQPEFAQPLCTAVQIGLVDILGRWGVVPDSVVGHSSGEVAAAYAAGAIGMKTAIAISYYRGQAIKRAGKSGSMLALGMGKHEVQPYLRDSYVIAACENSPQSTTLSGGRDQLENVLKRIKSDRPDMFHRYLRVDAAYHSHHMTKVGEVYERLLQPHVHTNRSMVPMSSTVTGAIFSDPSQLKATYWRKNLESPVLFRSAIEAAIDSHSDQNHLFVEIGPHSALSGPLQQIFRESSRKIKLDYVSTLVRRKEQESCLLATAGRLHLRHIPVDLVAINGHGQVLTDLPPYPWKHDKKYWHESRTTKEWRQRQFPSHELLGFRQSESSDLEPTWRNIVRLENIPWVLDHKVGNDVIFPGAGYIAMAGEAIRQISNIRDYSIRDLFIRAPLVVGEDANIEMVTGLKAAKITNSLDSAWYEFTISAYSNGEWFKCCIGQVRPGKHGEHSVREVQVHPRKVSTVTWYNRLRGVGLEFGPKFRLLDNISASVDKQEATAAVNNDSQNMHSPYPIHPVVMDQAFQLLGVAASHGSLNRISKISVPVSIEEIYVAESRSPLSLASGYQKSNDLKSKFSTPGEAIAISNGEVALSLKGVVGAALDSRGHSETCTVPLASRVDWKPDIDFFPGKDLLSPAVGKTAPLELLAKAILLVLIEMVERVQGSDPDLAHSMKYETWANSNLARFQELYTLIPGSLGLGSITTSSKTDLLEELRSVAVTSAPELRPFGKILRRVTDIFEGKTTLVQFFTDDDGWKSFYEFAATWADWNTFLTLLGHSNPLLNILEIDGGVGGATAAVVNSLRTEEGTRQYSTYTFSDASQDRVDEAQERFSEQDAFEFAVLDISRDPLEQGFTKGVYDLVIVSDMLHATTNTVKGLRNIRQLLAPGGRLLSRNLLPTVPTIDYIMSFLPNFGLFKFINPINQTSSTQMQWKKALLEAGFTGVDADTHGFGYPWDLKLGTVSRAPLITPPKRNINLLYGSRRNTWSKNVKRLFLQQGYEVSWCTLENLSTYQGDVISLLDLEGPFFNDISQETYNSFRLAIAHMKGRMLWVTRPSQMDCNDPRFSFVLGLARTLRYEAEMDFVTFEIDRFDDTAADKVVKVYEKLARQHSTGGEEPEREFSLNQGTVYNARFHWLPLKKQLISTDTNVLKKLEVVKPGDMQSLEWEERAIGNLRPDQVEVNISHVGLNFRDVMLALGFLNDIGECGFEASGTIRRVGSAVRRLNPGDRVIVLDTGLFTTRKITSEGCCLLIPKQMSTEEAATVSVAYGTAVYSLCDLGRLEKGQSVLIQSASGAVGQAAINVCKEIGAVIYATVGSEQKAQFLVNTFGIPRRNIFSSTTASFQTDIMRETGGKGVDIVLNSLSGELLHASWECVAKFGKMVEIGKRDFIGQGSLRMDKFASNRAFFGFDLLQLFLEAPEKFCRLRGQMNSILHKGKALKPIQPIQVIDAMDIETAFRTMKDRSHMGKIVVKMPVDTAKLPATIKQKVTFSSEASYILVGGLGGIGRAVSNWMVENGARNLTYLSRSGRKDPDNQAFIEELEQRGCAVVSVTGSVAKIDDVRRTVAASPRTIAGVIHLSMVNQPEAFFESTHEKWVAVHDPKVNGLWNLHNAVPSENLDFLVMTSSIASLCGNQGQANYASANSFLDAFVRYRWNQRQSASVLNLGAVGDVGCIPASPEYLMGARAGSVRLLTEKEVVDAMEVAISRSKYSAANAGSIGYPQVVAGMSSTKPLSDPTIRRLWARDARYRNYAHVEPTTAHGSQHTNVEEALRGHIREAEMCPSKLDDPEFEKLVLTAVGYRMAPQLADSADYNQIAALVVDSILLIETKSWLRRNIGVDLALSDVTNVSTVGELSTALVKLLQAKYDSAK